jgi:hypothetical protein
VSCSIFSIICFLSLLARQHPQSDTSIRKKPTPLYAVAAEHCTAARIDVDDRLRSTKTYCIHFSSIISRMANGCCTNTTCADRETQLRLARLREELLTNFNALLIDRIRFLEHTINQWSASSGPPSAATSNLPTDSSSSATPGSRTTTRTTTTTTADRLSTPPSTSLLRRSSSTTAYFLQSPLDVRLPENAAGARSCPSSVDLSSNDDRRSRFFHSKKSSRNQNRTYSDSNSGHHPSIPMDVKWSTLTNDLITTSTGNNEKGRLESRRFACDVDDNEVRALKAMIYMEQARKQNARPLTRLRQALGMSNNASTGHFSLTNFKKHSNA